MRSVIIILGLLLSVSCLANNGEDSLNIPYKTIYKLDLFRAFQGTIQLSREAKIKNNWVYDIGLMGTYASTRGLAKPYLKAQDFAYTDLSDYKIYNLDNVELLGYGINIQLRRYSGKPGQLFNGFYAAPECFARKLNLQSTINTNQLSKEINKKLFLSYLGYLIGYQKIIRDVVSIDSYLGGGFFYSKYTEEKKPTHYRNSYQVDFTGIFFNAGILIGITH